MNACEISDCHMVVLMYIIKHCSCLESFLLNILVLPNNEDKYCYLQFNVTRKIEKISAK
jgi:hypothetical protein